MRKILFITLLLILSPKIYSQPGCVPEKSVAERFVKLSDSINKFPDNYNLRWERIETIQTRTCDKMILTKPKQDNLIEYSDDSSAAYYKIDLINELSLLIDKNVKIDSRFDYLRYDRHNFHYLRGEIYLSNNDTINALADFHKALETSYQPLKVRVAKSLSDYYLSLNRKNSVNYKQYTKKTLGYLDLVSPVEFSESLTGSEIEPFIYEKKELLERLQEDKRLEKYLLNLINYTFLAIPTYDEFQINSHIEGFIENVYNLSKFYYEKNDYSRAKKLIDLLLKHQPDNQHFYIYNDSYKWAPMLDLMNKIYQTKEYKNNKLELDFLLRRLYADPLFNISFNTEYLKNILNKYPNDARVYISWTYIKLMDEYLRGENQIEKDYPLSLTELFNKIEKLNFKGFELPYLKAVYYLKINKPDLALSEINKALKLYDGAKLIRLKADILRKQLNPDYEEIEKLTEKIRRNYFKYEDLSELLNQVNKIASH